MGTLSNKSVILLELIARGHTYEQILRLSPGCTVMDIAIAAREILDHVRDKGVTTRNQPQRYAEMRMHAPRAYLPWTADEEQELLSLFDGHAPVNVIALKLARRPTAVTQRLKKLGRRVDEPS